MPLPDLPEPVPAGLIASDDAYDLIAKHGVVGVVSRPACEHIQLGNDSRFVLTFWYGGDDIPTYWTLEEA